MALDGNFEAGDEIRFSGGTRWVVLFVTERSVFVRRLGVEEADEACWPKWGIGIGESATVVRPNTVLDA